MRDLQTVDFKTSTRTLAPNLRPEMIFFFSQTTHAVLFIFFGDRMTCTSVYMFELG